MFDEDDLLPLSALSHLVFCERRAALIHLERLWRDNELTVEGTHLHERVDEEGRRAETRAIMRIARGLSLRSLRLGLAGRADVVEFRRAEAGGNAPPVPCPVEYKRGVPKPDESDRVQLCAQALCLEEMLGVAVPAGALFYHTQRHRHQVAFDAGLRAFTAERAARLHELLTAGRTPPAVREPKCRRCSIAELCLPELAGRREGAGRYLRRLIEGS
jgi:CRISPR-associated exonuclease Cas4